VTLTVTSPVAAADVAAADAATAASAALMIDFQSMCFSLTVVQAPFVASLTPRLLPNRKKQR
jgi:hypothetical protein